MSTQDLQWLIVRKNNSFLVKQKGLGRVFSREPGNLASLHSYKYSGVINDKGVGIVPAENGRGVVVTKKKVNANPRGVRGIRSSSTIKGGSRKVAGAVANLVTKGNYRADLRKAAVARATAIVRAQTGKPFEKRVYAPRGKAALAAPEVAAPEQE
ncbi:hypothetical protein MCUN1_002386 [Malassezia cuniculi]|uniref:Ribosomal eL28/Mak16 domain-containing protein n=1 Tax=Malassezia cuniculi TaxID=948313 RepID=A0AAF0ERX3_9BASI|nr:hypothetical protein MCUN1_002386 [Malassezia cuniculi]